MHFLFLNDAGLRVVSRSGSVSLHQSGCPGSILSYLTSRTVLVAPMLRLWGSMLFTAGDDGVGGPPGDDDAGDDGKPKRFSCVSYTV